MGSAGVVCFWDVRTRRVARRVLPAFAGANPMLAGAGKALPPRESLVITHVQYPGADGCRWPSACPT